MSNIIVSKYKIFCDTEDAFVEGWSEASPTTCYTNSGHTVNVDSVQLIEHAYENVVKINQNQVSAGNNRRVVATSFADMDEKKEYTAYYTVPVASALYSVKFIADDMNKGDILTISMNPDTDLGLIEANVSASDTSFVASATFLAAAQVGYHVTLDDGVNADYLGEILSIDTNTGVVVMSEAAVHAFEAASTHSLMTVYLIKDMVIGPAAQYAFFDEFIEGYSLPADTVFKFTYNNQALIDNITSDPTTFVVNMTLQY
jgi:hypothetical protein